MTAASSVYPSLSSTDPLIPGAVAPLPPRRWSHLQRVLFRISFAYFFLFAFCYGNGTIFDYCGPVGEWLNSKLVWPLNHLADFVSTHLLHFSGVGATHHRSGSGDLLVIWVQQVLLIALSVAVGLLWSAIAAASGNRYVEYSTAHAWLRFLLRLTCGMFMLEYGFAKVFPLQMRPISTAVLTEPVGNMSPMTMLWSLLALHPGYEMICGGAEVLGGLLLLFRRTALAGALLSAFVMTNVLLYNIFFDVPVKLFAANLLLALAFIALPDIPALFRFFVLHRPAAPTGVWLPPASRRAFRWTTLAIEWIFVGTFVLLLPFQMWQRWKGYSAAQRSPFPIRGAWSLDAPSAAVLADPEHQAITALYMDSPTLVRARASSGELWRAGAHIDPKTPKDVHVGIYAPPGSQVDFHWALIDADHLQLTPVAAKGSKAPLPPALHLTRIALPAHYFLLDRGYHWVNEWGLER